MENGENKPEFDPQALDKEFDLVEKERDELVMKIASCRFPRELAEVLSKYEHIPGTERMLPTAPMISELKTMSGRHALYLGDDENILRMQRDRYVKYLRNFTRAYGIRKKVAEIIGVTTIVPESILEEN